MFKVKFTTNKLKPLTSLATCSFAMILCSSEGVVYVTGHFNHFILVDKTDSE